MLNIPVQYKKEKVQSNSSQENTQHSDSKVSGNRRRSHVHFIHQYEMPDMNYTGTRVVIFIKGGAKLAFDTEGFEVHLYKNPKLKNNETSAWKISPCNIFKVTRKEMINYSEDKKFKMNHVIYESPYRPIEDFICESFKEENIEIPYNFKNEFCVYEN